MSRIIYLDNAATSYPKPEICLNEINKCMREYCANPGRGSHYMSIKAAEKIYETREIIGKIINADKPERIVFTQNTTMSINMAVKGLLKNGDEVIISSMEHNSVWRAVNSLSDKGVIVKTVWADKNGRVSSQDIKNEITPKTKLVCITHVSNVTGSINDIYEIGNMLSREKIIFMVDAAQSIGIIPIDVKKCKIDLLAFPGHKGLLGPMGTGGLFVSEGVHLDTIIEGGTGSVSESRYQPDFLPDRLESGTVNMPGISGLCASVEFIKKIGIDKIENHEKKLGKRLCEILGNINGITIYGGENKTGVVSVTHKDLEPAYMAEILDREYKIAVRSGLHCSPLAAKTLGTEEGGTLRFSPGIFNSIKDIEYAGMAVKRIIE